jgi:N-acetyl-anhydromuramyl-L-alanine amidase AmpD
MIDSSGGLTTIVGIARQNIAVGIKKAPVSVPEGALCRPIIADRNYDVDQLKKTYGNDRLAVESQLVAVKFMGKDVRVHRLVSAPLGCVEQVIKTCEQGKKYDFRTVDSYVWQPLESDPSLLKTNSFGIALDINLDTNPNSQDGSLKSDLPSCVVEAFKRFGFRWGGDNKNLKTPSHFEFMADPNLVTVVSREDATKLSALTPSCSRSGKSLKDGITVTTPDYGQIVLNPSQECTPPCQKKLITRPDFVINNKNKMEYFVVHTTAGGDGTVAYFTRGKPGSPHVGTQYVIGRDGLLTQLAVDSAYVYHAPGFNKIGIGVENQNSENLCPKICTEKRSYCGPEDCKPRPPYPENPTKTDKFQKWLFGRIAEDWPDVQEKALVKLAAETMIRHDMPIKNIVRHADSSAYRKKGHYDPGPQFVWERFKLNVQAAINQYNVQVGNCKESGQAGAGGGGA